VRTASGATAVQIVYSNRRGARDIEHIGSAHDEARLELLKAAARQRLAAGQGELDVGTGGGGAGRGGVRDGGPLPITSTRMRASVGGARAGVLSRVRISVRAVVSVLKENPRHGKTAVDSG
jgi:hypothetical protein